MVGLVQPPKVNCEQTNPKGHQGFASFGSSLRCSLWEGAPKRRVRCQKTPTNECRSVKLIAFCGMNMDAGWIWANWIHGLVKRAHSSFPVWTLGFICHRTQKDEQGPGFATLPLSQAAAVGAVSLKAFEELAGDDAVEIRIISTTGARGPRAFGCGGSLCQGFLSFILWAEGRPFRQRLMFFFLAFFEAT